MKKKRLSFIFLIFLIAFFVLLFRLFDLTIIHGETYRNFSDNNRMKKINIDATRGNIYDRNGEPIATSRLIYTLNAYSDRFNRLDDEEKENTLIKLTKILEEEGVNYQDDFFLSIYEFMYKDLDAYYKNDLLPYQRIIKIIQDNNLLKDIFLRSYSINDELTYYPIKRMREYLILKGKEMPVEISTSDGIKIEFNKNDDYDYLLDNNKITETTKAIDYIVEEVKNDDSFILNLISHPLSRKIVYDILKEKNLNGDIVLSDIIFTNDLLQIENKVSLSRKSPNISYDTDAKSDFLNLVKENALETLLSTAYTSQDRLIVPASILISEIEKKGIETNLTYDIDEESNSVQIYFENDDEKSSAVDELINIAIENDIIDDYILSNNIVNYAERALFDNGIYPRIYKNSWEYSYVSDKKDLLKKYEKELSSNELFNELKKEYSIGDINDYLAFGAISIANKLNSQGYFAYNPVKIANILNNTTLVKLEEEIPQDSGFEIVFQPNRYYPNGNIASHVVGYMGPISESYEIEEYVEYKKYDLNDTVGKTGLEESFEDTLRGSKGSKLVYTDVYGQTTDTIEEIKAIPGNNLYTTIDLDFQKEVEDILNDGLVAIRNGEKYQSYFGPFSTTKAENAQIATAVVMDVNTGAIRAMVSLPDYNPNIFVNGISNYDWNKLNDMNDKDIYAPRPILNNVTQSAFLPGSTFKTVVSLAALENGLDPKDNIDAYGFIQIGPNKFNDLIYTRTGGRWGNINLYDALKVSSNYYFYVLGLGYNPNKENDNDIKVTLDDIESITSRLGLQSPTNIEINIPRESSGHYPNLNGKRSILKSQLRSFLNTNLKKYALEETIINEDKLLNDIDTIVSWIDSGKEMSRQSVEDNLIEMGYDVEIKPDNRRDNLPDLIKYSYLNMAVWTQSDSLNMVIGQGQNAYTPMQMVQLAGIIANDGVKIQPTLVEKISNYNSTENIFTQTPKKSQTGIEKVYFADLKEGMRRVSNEAQYRNQFPFEIGSKTGTAQVGSINPNTGEEYDEFISEIAFAPYENPEIAVYVSIPQGVISSNVRGLVNDVIYAYYKYAKDDKTYSNQRLDSVFYKDKSEKNEINLETTN